MIAIYLAEPELVLLSGELEVTSYKDEDAADERRRLAVDGGDGVVALLERQLRELPTDLVGAQDLLPLEGEHGGLVVEACERGTVGVEEVVVVIHKGLGHHLELLFHFPLPLILVHPRSTCGRSCSAKR